MQGFYPEFKDAGAEVVAVAVADVEAVSRGVRRPLQLTYPLLADPHHEVAEAYGVYDLFGDGLAAPSTFIIDLDGTVIWSYVGRAPEERPGPTTILGNLP